MFFNKGKKNKIVLVAMDLESFGTLEEKKIETDKMTHQLSSFFGKGYTTIVYDRRHQITILDD